MTVRPCRSCGKYPTAIAYDTSGVGWLISAPHGVKVNPLNWVCRYCLDLFDEDDLPADALREQAGQTQNPSRQLQIT
jgi:hypothetical protein